MLRKIALSLALLIMAGSMAACGSSTTGPPSSESLTASEIAAIRDYTDTVIGKLDMLYAKFEGGEAQAKRISDERQAPYQMAIGSMAEVRKVADEVEALNVPQGAEAIAEAAMTELRNLQAGLEVIASTEASEVSLTDPGEFYVAYLDVLIEIPELKAKLQSLAQEIAIN